MRSLIVLLSLVLVTGCATRGASSIKNLSISIQELQRVATDALPLGKRGQSQNERELTSEYFIEKDGEYESARGSKIRKYAQILILGDRRPYTIEVTVAVEARDAGGEYSLVKYDQGVARVITRRIQNALHKRREDRNIIDDFRVF